MSMVLHLHTYRCSDIHNKPSEVAINEYLLLFNACSLSRLEPNTQMAKHIICQNSFDLLNLLFWLFLWISLACGFGPFYIIKSWLNSKICFKFPCKIVCCCVSRRQQTASLDTCNGVEGGCWRCCRGKGGWGGGQREDQKILFSSTQQPSDEPAGEDCVYRLEPGDETRADGCCGPGNASCQTVHRVQHMSFSTYSSTMQSPLHYKDDRTAHILCWDDRYVISLKTLFVFHRCMSSFILPADSAHATFPHSFPR